jgi:peptidoglycan/xylan/chitin deacetylase (PgdA/CDA1 family)
MGWHVDIRPSWTTRKIEPAVCYCFDDSSRSVYLYARPHFVNEGVCGTFFMNSGSIGGAPGQYGEKCSWAEVEEMAQEFMSTGTGIDIQDHTHGHTPLNPASRTTITNLEAEIQLGFTTFAQHGIFPNFMAYPGGAINLRGKQLLQKYYLGARNGNAAGPICNLDDVDLYQLAGQGVYLGDTMKLTKLEDSRYSIENLIEDLDEKPGIHFGCIHSLYPVGGTPNGVREDVFLTSIQMLKAAGIRIISVAQAYNELSNRGPTWCAGPT